MEGARPGWERKNVSLPRPTLPKRVKSALLDTLFLQTLCLPGSSWALDVVGSLPWALSLSQRHLASRFSHLREYRDQKTLIWG